MNNIITICVPYTTKTTKTIFVDVEIDYKTPEPTVDDSDWDYYGCFDIVAYSCDYPNDLNLNKLKVICREYTRDMIIDKMMYLS